LNEEDFASFLTEPKHKRLSTLVLYVSEADKLVQFRKLKFFNYFFAHYGLSCCWT